MVVGGKLNVRFPRANPRQVFFPVNLGNTHWCLAVIFMQEKKIQYYDSMSGAGTRFLQGLKR